METEEIKRKIGIKIRLKKDNRMDASGMPVAQEVAWRKQKDQVGAEAKKMTVLVEEQYHSVKTFVGKDVYETEDEWFWTNKLAGKAVMEVAWKAAHDAGLLSQDYRQFEGNSVRREDKESYGLREDDWHDLWGVLVLTTKMKMPKGVTEGETSSKTLRGLAHEMGHFIRVISNRWFWGRAPKGIVDELDEPKLDEVVSTHIGGRTVGSYAVGGEATGDLMASIVEERLRRKQDPSIREVIPGVVDRLKRAVEKNLDLNHKLGDLTLLHHLVQLDRMGYGDLPAQKLASMAACGYISLEKMPELILLGLVDNEVVEKVGKVVSAYLDWATPLVS